MLNRTGRQPEYFSRLCRNAFVTGAVVGLGWLLVFMLAQYWSLVILLLVMGTFILLCLILLHRGYFSAAMLAAQTVYLLFVCLFCLLFDVPGSEVNRTTHLWLLVIALVGYIHYQKTPSHLQAGMIAASLLAFIVFCSEGLIFPFAQPLPPPFREISSWVNAVMSTAMLAGGVTAMLADASCRTDLEKQLQQALEKNEFILLYQAQISADGGVLGAEALLRWQHPVDGLRMPDAFLPDAQQYGLMPEIGEWVLREACHQLQQWQQQSGTARLTLSVNVTADHMLRPDFVSRIMEMVSTFGVNPSRLRLELTESVFASDMPVIVTVMEKLAESGVRFSLDDFGTGFSSLSYLRQLPLEQLKIDRSFVLAASESEKGRVVARNIIRMGRELKLKVLAEGIEDTTQWRMMRAFGCDAFQGYYFSRPVSASDFENTFFNRGNRGTGKASPAGTDR